MSAREFLTVIGLLVILAGLIGLARATAKEQLPEMLKRFHERRGDT